MLELPWTEKQVDGLNQWQAASWTESYTCEERSRHPLDPGILVARTDGWHCPVEGCTYVQKWALVVTAHPEWWMYQDPNKTGAISGA